MKKKRGGMEYTSSFRDQLYYSAEPSWMDNLNDELYHYGIKGMHWGVRRFQNSDGTLTSAGRKRKKRLLRAVESSKRDAKVYRRSANEYEKYAESHPVLGIGAQALADKSRAYARIADRDAKLASTKLTFDKNKINKARREWLIDVAKDSSVGATTREAYKRNRKAGKGRINSAIRGVGSELLTTSSYPIKGYVYKK